MDESRKQFEQWVKFHLDDKYSEVPLYKNKGGANYLDSNVDLAWIAWQTSRAAIELDIDWPEANDDTWMEGEDGAYARGHEDGKDKVVIAVREAIRAAGIKVKE